MTRQHVHQCAECGRDFYLCSQRDCCVAPEVCRGCELDRQDHWMNTQEANRADHRESIEKF